MISRKEVKALQNQSVNSLKRIHSRAEKARSLSYTDLAYLWNMIMIKQREENRTAKDIVKRKKAQGFKRP
jgi:hypothetical protein